MRPPRADRWPAVLRHACGALAGLALAGCTNSSAISILVVDAADGKPLEGVYVIRDIQAKSGTITGDGGSWTHVLTQEGTTDRAGRVVLRSERVNSRPYWLNTSYVLSRVYFYKSGYEPTETTYDEPFDGSSPEIYARDQRPGAIRLTRGTGGEDDLEKVKWFVSYLWMMYDVDVSQCTWRKTPLTLLAIERDMSLIRNAAYARNQNYSFGGWHSWRELDQPSERARCGSAAEFFASFDNDPAAPKEEPADELDTPEKAAAWVRSLWVERVGGEQWASQMEPLEATPFGDRGWRVRASRPPPPDYQGTNLTIYVGRNREDITITLGPPNPRRSAVRMPNEGELAPIDPATLDKR